MDNELIEVVEYIRNGRVHKKTVNGIDIPPEKLNPLPTVVVQKFTLTIEEVENEYGKQFIK